MMTKVRTVTTGGTMVARDDMDDKDIDEMNDNDDFNDDVDILGSR